eukprot:3767019-Prymnesium_polylepis.1
MWSRVHKTRRDDGDVTSTAGLAWLRTQHPDDDLRSGCAASGPRVKAQCHAKHMLRLTCARPPNPHRPTGMSGGQANNSAAAGQSKGCAAAVYCRPLPHWPQPHSTLATGPVAHPPAVKKRCDGSASP